ncbi:MAG: NAD(P)H-hydrate dehydratase, partial [Sphingobacteriales bacterium]
MKIFSADQIRACDQYTIREQGISSSELMERAAMAAVGWLQANLPDNSLFIVLCGPGNNGGDGLAITRLLHERGYGVKAFLLELAPLAADCSLNLERLREKDPSLVSLVPAQTFITEIPSQVIIIDAILGTGLNRAASGWLASFIRHINGLPNRKIAIDIPTGMAADFIPAGAPEMLGVSDTISFQFYKRSFLHPEAGKLAGRIHLPEIGLSQEYISSTPSGYQTISEELVYNIYTPRESFAHKGTFGKALLIGGSYGMIGAISLSAEAAGRAGAGVVKALIPACGYAVFQTLVPQALCITNGDNQLLHFRGWEDADAIGIGPGMGTAEKTGAALEAFLGSYTKPLVLDADAINTLAKKQELLSRIPKGSILTPHPTEFDRLSGKSTDSMQRLEQARAMAMLYKICIVLKGRFTAVISEEGDCWYNLTGNPALATGGSGDVLTGMITGLLAQG